MNRVDSELISNRRERFSTCNDQVVGDILSGWRYDISGLSPAMRTDYEQRIRNIEAEAREHIQQAVKEVYDELAAGMPAKVADRAPSPAVQQSMIGGMAALVMERVEAGEGERLTALLPDLLEIFFTPYLGREEAVKEARKGS